jgi:hypothetical protein
MMTLLSLLARLPGPQLPNTGGSSGNGTEEMPVGAETAANSAAAQHCSATSSISSSNSSSTNAATGVGTCAGDTHSPSLMSPDCWRQHVTAIHRAVDSFMRGVLSMTEDRLLWDGFFQPVFLEGLLLTTLRAGEDRGV